MVKSIVNKFWGMRKEFAKYFIIGVSAFTLDIGSLYLFKQYLHWTPVVAVVVNQLFMINYVFFLNKYWSFRADGVTRWQMMKFLMLSGFNYVFSVTWMWFFTEYKKIQFVDGEYGYLIIRTVNVILSVMWNFFLYKYWVYTVKRPENQTPTTENKSDQPGEEIK